MTEMPTGQVPGLYRRRLGRMVVTAVSDGTLPIPPSILLGLSEAEVAALLTDAFQPPSPLATVNVFLVQGPDCGTVLIDAGAGTLAGAAAGHMLANLAAAGVRPADIGTILLTHIHMDHTGGLLRDGAAAFPNAEIVVAGAEAQFWLDPEREARAPEARKSHFARARAELAPYADRIRPITDGTVLPGIAAVPLPGHTPGHTGYRIKGDGEDLLVWGDVAHIPEIQLRRPDISVAYDLDPAQAATTRRAVLAQAAAERTLVAGMHLHFPALAYVTPEGNGYRLVPDRWRTAL